MHFGRIGDAGDEIPVALIDDRLYDITPITADIDGAFLAGDPVAAVTARRGELSEVPDPRPAASARRSRDPGAVYCIGLNYAAHAREGGSEPPKEIIVFLKPSNTVVGPDDDASLSPREPTPSTGRPNSRRDRRARLAASRRGSGPRRDRGLHGRERPLRADLAAGTLRRAVVEGQGRPGLLSLGPWLVTADSVDVGRPADLQHRQRRDRARTRARPT